MIILMDFRKLNDSGISEWGSELLPTCIAHRCVWTERDLMNVVIKLLLMLIYDFLWHLSVTCVTRRRTGQARTQIRGWMSTLC